jgi:endonuclease/exonuclease/phosphatase family metal-dependent hydrolase
MTITNKKIWLMTWNTEYGYPNDAQLQSLGAEVNSEQPDIIAIGLQEVTPGSYDDAKMFMAEALHARGGINPADGDAVYNHYECGSIKGVTKPGFGKREGYNYQQMGILVKSSEVANGNFADLECGTSTKGLGSEKGAVMATFTYCEKRIGIVSTHASAESVAKVDDSLRSALAHLDGTRLKDWASVSKQLGEDYDLSFIMGDLNCRITPKKDDKELNAKTTKDTMAAQLLSHEGRKALIALDPLKTTSICKDCGFIFPDPTDEDGNVAFPTYKRLYDKKTRSPVDESNPVYKFHVGHRNLAQVVEADRQKALQRLTEYLKAGYFVADLWNAERECFDMGWLDRVGFLHGKKATDFELRCDSFTDRPTFCVGDHALVVFKGTFVAGNGFQRYKEVKDGHPLAPPKT